MFWLAYSSSYNFASLSYLFSPSLALITFAVSMIGILGSTLLACSKELGNDPAILMRPDSNKKGKRIFLERIKFIWKPLPFLHKITLRNMFRYKRRLIMMLVGISCCTALVVTAFGVRDSMVNTGTHQFEDVQHYDMEVSFLPESMPAVKNNLSELEDIKSYLMCNTQRVDVVSESTIGAINMYSFSDASEISDYWSFYCKDKEVSFPQSNEVIISRKIAEKLNLAIGDSVELRNTDLKSGTMIISGIFDNYVDNSVFAASETVSDSFGSWQENTALVQAVGNTEEMSRLLLETNSVTGIVRLSETENSINSSLSCLDYIMWLIVLFSGALAFIVIFNLTNINLAERSREIATVEVLGFNEKETRTYVLSENITLSVLASFIGLPLGALFHRIVMYMIKIDTLSFDINVTAVSYSLALICTVVFAIVVNLFMRKNIYKINMAESLKAVE